MYNMKILSTVPLRHWIMLFPISIVTSTKGAIVQRPGRVIEHVPDQILVVFFPVV